MRDIINATLGNDHVLNCSTFSIARNGEGLTPCLSISIPENLTKYWAYLDFKKPNGETFKTPRIDVADGKIEYNLLHALLDVEGKLEVQVIFQNENNEIWKSYVKEFVVRYSINATDDIPEKQDFITEAQKLLDEAVATAESVEERANNGEFNGKDGDNYILTENDKQEIANMVNVGGGTWQKIVDITTTEEANGIVATLEEFPNLAKCKEFLVRAVYQPSANGEALGSARLDFIRQDNTKAIIFRFSSTTLQKSGLAEHRCQFFIVDNLIQSVATDTLNVFSNAIGSVKMAVGDRFIDDFSAITYYNNDKNNLPIGTQLIIYGKVEN